MTSLTSASDPLTAPQIAVPGAGRRRLARFFRRRTTLVGVVMLGTVLLLAALAPVLATADPLSVNPSQALQPPGPGHWMGTDNLGRDVWSRFLYGGRISLTVGLLACALGAGVGVSLGIVAGYYGRWPDALLVWGGEVLLAFPGILLAMVIVTILGAGIQNVIIAVGIAFIPSFLRMARGSVLSARNEMYVDAARVVGARDRSIMFRHILPNIGRPLLVLLTIGVGGAILEGAALSFLGLGAQPPSPEWGAMLNAGQNFMRVGWWIGLFPGLGIFVTVLAVNLIGDALGDMFGQR